MFLIIKNKKIETNIKPVPNPIKLNDIYYFHEGVLLNDSNNSYNNQIKITRKLINRIPSPSLFAFFSDFI